MAQATVNSGSVGRLWQKDRLLVVILVLTATLSAWLWWVPIRCLVEGSAFQWVNEVGVGRIGGAGTGGAGTGGDFLVLIVLSAFLISLLFSGWRGAGGMFKGQLLFWSLWNVIAATTRWLTDHRGYRFRGDTWGIDVNLGVLMPVLHTMLLVLVSVWLAREWKRPRQRIQLDWGRRNQCLLGAAVATVAVAAIMLRVGPMHDVTDQIGWTLTIVSWLLLNLALLPWRSAQRGTSSA